MEIRLLFTVCLSLILSGCASKTHIDTNGQKWQDEWTNVGTNLGIEVPEQFVLTASNETLAADGMYYASWGTGKCVPYKNSNGDNIDLYDAQLYLLTSEASSTEKAKSSCDTWLSAAKENYEVQEEDNLNINGQDYTLLRYNCISEDNPYDRDISVFGICDDTAICAELTCLLDYTQDLETLLTNFLNGCHFKAD